MKELYFYQDRGETIGPITFDDVKERIRDGRLRLFDLVYRDGEESWRMALEHSALRSEFKSSTLSSLKEKPWVCLQRKGETDSDSETDFITTGPFTKDDIAERLQTGQISYSDYAWKDGFNDWKRIGALEEFNPRVRQAPPIPIEPEPPASELLQNVVELKRPRIKEPEIPPEAKTVDLTKITDTPPPLSKNKKKAKGTSRASAPPDPAPVASEPAPQPERRRRKRSRFAFDWGLVGVLLLVLAGMVLIVSRFALPRRAAPPAVMTPSLETAPPETPAKSPPPPSASTMDSAEPSTEENSEADNDTAVEDEKPARAKSPGKAPHELVLNVQTVSANQARIELRTDASSDHPVYLQVVGLPGQVSEGASFYRFMRITPNGNSQLPLDLSALKLPQGRFILRAETGSLKKEAKLNLGLGDATFKTAVARQRKMWAHAIWRERLQLFKLSETLEKNITQGLVPIKKFSAKGLDPLFAFKRAAGAKYLMFEDWSELSQIAKEAKAGPNPSLLARAQKERERLSMFSVWK